MAWIEERALPDWPSMRIRSCQGRSARPICLGHSVRAAWKLPARANSTVYLLLALGGPVAIADDDNEPQKPWDDDALRCPRDEEEDHREANRY